MADVPAAMLSRRALLPVMAMAPALLLGACQTGLRLARGQRVGAIRIDVSRLAELGVGPRAAWIRDGLDRELRRLLPGVGEGGGVTVSVAVRALTLPTYVGSASDDDAGQDSLESLVTLTGPRGEPLRRWPLLSSNGAGDAGAWYDAELVDKRVALLVVNHARWIAREIGG